MLREGTRHTQCCRDCAQRWTVYRGTVCWKEIGLDQLLLVTNDLDLVQTRVFVGRVWQPVLEKETAVQRS